MEIQLKIQTTTEFCRMLVIHGLYCNLTHTEVLSLSKHLRGILLRHNNYSQRDFIILYIFNLNKTLNWHSMALTRVITVP